MSITYSFFCPEDGTKIWAGQRHHGENYLYTNEKDWPTIEKWLFEHLGKDIKLVDEFYFGD